MENADSMILMIFVRLEIATALKRGIRVIPVLVDGASMPRSGDLPDELKTLVRLQALRVSRDRFRNDSEPLLTGVVQALKGAGAERRKRGSKFHGKRTSLSVIGAVAVLKRRVARSSCIPGASSGPRLLEPGIMLGKRRRT